MPRPRIKFPSTFVANGRDNINQVHCYEPIGKFKRARIKAEKELFND